MKKILLFIVLLFLVGSCQGRQNYILFQPTQPNINHISVSNKNIAYKILVQDRLSVSLYKDPSQNLTLNMSSNNILSQYMNKRGILVNTAGNIILPLIGSIKVSGLTQTQAAQHITQAYKKHLNTPTVYVEVLNKRIFILGEVNKPGVINLNKEKMTLLEALAHAGDLTDAAKRTEIIIISNNKDNHMHLRRVNLTNFDTLSYASLQLSPNDIVYVQPNAWKQFKINAGNLSSPFSFIAKIAAPFVTLKYLND